MAFINGKEIIFSPHIHSSSSASGTKNITANGTHDVESYKYAAVNVPQPSGSVNITANGTYDVTDKASAVVNVPSQEPTLQSKTLTIGSSAPSTVSPDSGYDGLSSVAVSLDSTVFKADNIKHGVTLAGITGTLETETVDLSLVRYEDSFVQTKNGLIKYGYNGGGYRTEPIDGSGNYLDVDFSRPFEIGIVFRLISIPTRSNVLFGCSTTSKYFLCPTLEIQSGGIWAGFSTGGEKWNYSAFISETHEIGKSYFVKYKYDGTTFKLSATSDYTQYQEQSKNTSTGHYHSNPDTLCFGGVARSGNHNCVCAEINLKGTYIKSNNNLIWGCDYLEQNEIFE